MLASVPPDKSLEVQLEKLNQVSCDRIYQEKAEQQNR